MASSRASTSDNMAQTKTPWCDGPYELIPATKTGAKVGVKQTGGAAAATEMMLIHNVYIRGINSIHRQAANVAARGSPQDKLDFASFAFHWGLSVHHHHQLEEEAIFPRIAAETGAAAAMDGNVDEHRLFDAGLERFQAYVGDVREGRAELDGVRLTAMIDEVMPVLHTHLVNEIDTLLELRQYDDKVDVSKIFQEEVGAAANKAFKESTFRTDLFPLVMISHDKTFEDGAWAGFPPLPWLVSLAIRWVFCRTRQDWWRFAGCDTNSMPKPLPFA